MKKLLLLFVLVTSIGFSQDLKCEDFREGNFILHSSTPNTTIKVIRKGNTQTEELIKGPKNYNDVVGGKVIHSVLNWTEDCAFKMTFDSINHKLDKYDKIINDNGGILVEIDSIKGRCSYYKSSATIDGQLMVINGKICKE